MKCCSVYHHLTCAKISLQHFYQRAVKVEVHSTLKRTIFILGTVHFRVCYTRQL